MKSRIQLGDVFEFETSKGKAILHFIGKSYRPGSGEFIRVLEGLYLTLPEKLEEIVTSKERYIILFPCILAFRAKMIKKLGNVSHEKFQIPKIMKLEEIVRGEFKGWYLIDPNTKNRKFVKNLNEKEKQINPSGIWNPALLKERLEKNWSIDEWNRSYGD
ncbi:hypothetical protein EHQ94_02025 [Leptospira meyeri]|uniref:hypothetical protein n=1 Tax=Leptospira meyeri TaxID=29508 RepID=UPI001084345D|nr:hypothetical protein [Leptospira meyeri]TGM65837.1 hypothetical protein EHQ93_08805 [Leptospira meyeri]TGM72049.1 hypothetical protein EHQ94_02025 [Leptospira meyeri]